MLHSQGLWEICINMSITSPNQDCDKGNLKGVDTLQSA